MGTVELELLFNYLVTLWLPVGIIAFSITFFGCFKIHSENKLKGGGYIVPYLHLLKDDPEIRERAIRFFDKTEEAIKKDRENFQSNETQNVPLPPSPRYPEGKTK